MKTIFYSNYNLDDNYEEAKINLLDEYNEDEITDSMIWDYIYNDDTYWWNTVVDTLTDFFDNKTVILTGTIGRWNGRYAGGMIGDFKDVLYKFIDNCDYIEISFENNHLYIEASHHDGDNYGEFKILTDKGITYFDNWNYSNLAKYNYPKSECHRRIVNCSFLSRLPHFNG